jgi:hypothetical protein
MTNTEVLCVYNKLKASKQQYHTAVKTNQIRVAVLSQQSVKNLRTVVAFSFGIELLITTTVAVFPFAGNPSTLALVILFLALACPTIAFCLARWFVLWRKRAQVS